MLGPGLQTQRLSCAPWLVTTGLKWGPATVTGSSREKATTQLSRNKHCWRRGALLVLNAKFTISNTPSSNSGGRHDLSEHPCMQANAHLSHWPIASYSILLLIQQLRALLCFLLMQALKPLGQGSRWVRTCKQVKGVLHTPMHITPASTMQNSIMDCKAGSVVGMLCATVISSYEYRFLGKKHSLKKFLLDLVHTPAWLHSQAVQTLLAEPSPSIFPNGTTPTLAAQLLGGLLAVLGAGVAVRNLLNR
eukprot:856920-Pelagomonas_calceolata.AAC.3